MQFAFVVAGISESYCWSTFSMDAVLTGALGMARFYPETLAPTVDSSTNCMSERLLTSWSRCFWFLFKHFPIRTTQQMPTKAPIATATTRMPMNL